MKILESKFVFDTFIAFFVTFFLFAAQFSNIPVILHPMHHTQNEPNFEDGNESTDLDKPRRECIGVPDVLIVSCLYLEIIVDGVVRHVNSPSRAVPVSLSES